MVDYMQVLLETSRKPHLYDGNREMQCSHALREGEKDRAIESSREKKDRIGASMASED